MQSTLKLNATGQATNEQLITWIVGESADTGAMLKDAGNVYRLMNTDGRQLQQYDGIGPSAARRVVAAAELARRAEAERKAGPRLQVCSPNDVAAVYGPLMRDLEKEHFRIVLLNTANVIIGDYTVSVGGLAASIVEPRAVFKHAILENAAAVICLHNHPSQNPEPSREDIRITRQLVDAGKLMGIPLHDHLVSATRSC